LLLAAYGAGHCGVIVLREPSPARCSGILIGTNGRTVQLFLKKYAALWWCSVDYGCCTRRGDEKERL
jgi:hypothetical protein